MVNEELKCVKGVFTKSSVDIKDKIIIKDTYLPIKDYFNLINCPTMAIDEISHYTISRDGKIYKHLDLDTSVCLKDVEFDESIILISIESNTKLHKKGDKYLDDLKNEIPENEVFEKTWRGAKFWRKYDERQYQPLKEVIDYICNYSNITKEITTDNIFIDNETMNYKGVYSYSNFDKTTLGLNPSFNYEKII